VRVFLLSLALAFPAFAVEDLLGLITNLPVATGVLGGLARDSNDSSKNGTWFVKSCADDPTFVTGCDTPFLANSTGGTSTSFAYTIPATSGSVNLRDGAHHLLYLQVVSQANPGAGNVAVLGSPYPYTFTSGVIDQMYAPNLETVPSKLTAAQLGIVVNSTDTYSTGSAGSTVCTVSGTAIKSDGAAGSYILQYGVPCANVRVVTLTSASGYMTQANFESQLLPTTNAFSSSIQAIALAWVNPGQVNATTPSQGPRGISAVVAYGSFILGSANFSNNMGLAAYNPLFNSSTTTPYTTTGIRPTMMLAGESCVGCTSSINYWPTGVWTQDITSYQTTLAASVAANGTNPTGTVYWVYSGDTQRRLQAEVTSSLALGSGLIRSGITTAMVGSAASPYNGANNVVSGTNIIGYLHAFPHWVYGTSTFIPGAGLCGAFTSTSAFLPQDTGSQQSPVVSWLNQGCAAAYSTAVEPGILSIYKAMDLWVAMSHYGQGQTAVEALWKSVRLPWQGNFVGDPLAASFSIQSSSSPVSSQNVVFRNAILH
jgi:hypothetical protein